MSEIFETIQIMRKNLGPVTAYKYAVQQGYTGTEQEFAELMASYASIAQDVSAESRVAEGYALGKQNGIDVGDQSPYYHANAKYHAEQAAAKAQEAAESAAQAESAITVDPTLIHPGQAADAKATGDEISDVKSALDESANALSGDESFVVPTWLLGHYVNTLGEYKSTTNQQLACTKLIPLYGVYAIECNCNTWSGQAEIALYDKDKNVVQLYNNILSIYSIPPTAKYVRFSTYNTDDDFTSTGYVFYHYGKLAQMETTVDIGNNLLVDTINVQNTVIPFTLVQGGINTSYAETVSSKYVRSDFISVNSELKIEVKSPQEIFAVAIFEYGSNRQGIRVGSANYNYSTDLDENTKYIRLVIRRGNSSDITPSDVTGVTIGYFSPIKKVLNDVLPADSIEGIAAHPYSAKLAQVASHRVSDQSVKPFVLLHFSDIHGVQQNLNRLIAWKDQLIPIQLDDVICTGDMVTGNFTQSDILNTTEGAEDILQLIGNHDAYNTTSENIATGKQCYDKFFAPNIDTWNVTQPENAESSGLCYYYKDYATKNCRLICLDSMHVYNGQLIWLESILTDALNNNLNVVIASHYYSATGLQPIECSYTIRPVLTPSDFERMPESVYAIVDDFINDGGKFVCWIAGHSHFDYIGTITNHPDQVIILVESAGLTYAPSDDVRMAGTASQDSFNVIGFDTAYGLIKIVRIGSNVNKFMQSKSMLCYDYVNKQLLSCE